MIGSRLWPARRPMPALGLRAIGGTAMMGPRILGPRRLLAPAEPRVVHREGPRESAGYAYRGTIVGEASNPGPIDPAATYRGGGPSADRFRASTGVGKPRADFACTGGHRWLARWVGRGAPAVGNCLPCVPRASHSLVEVRWPPWVGLPPLRLARWASPGVGARAPPTAYRGRDRVSAPAMATGVSSLARPPTLGPSRPLPITRVPRRPARS